MYELYIGNKNYSSWSLRPWVLMRELRIDFKEHLIPFGDASQWATYLRIAPSGKVPCLIDGTTVVWDSLAIAEYLFERHPSVWPAAPDARAFARCAAAEMHSSFAELRNRCSMSCGVRIALNEKPLGLERDLTRLQTLWSEGLERFGGPFLAGKTFTAADAFYAPVAFRIRTYDLAVDPAAAAYVGRLLELASMQRWYSEAIAETFRDEPHEAEIRAMGTVLEDFRARNG